MASAFVAQQATAQTYGGGLPSKCSSIFAGTYSDPINHPGGTRSIVLNLDGAEYGGRDATIFGKRIATVRGGGGAGEPKSFKLEALIDGDDKGITIDFSPKGGPDGFKGKYEKNDDAEGIRFIKDRNFWPRTARAKRPTHDRPPCLRTPPLPTMQTTPAARCFGRWRSLAPRTRAAIRRGLRAAQAVMEGDERDGRRAAFERLPFFWSARGE